MTPKEILGHFVFLFIPVGILYVNVKSDLKEFYTTMGAGHLNFGVLGPMTSGVGSAANVEEEE